MPKKKNDHIQKKTQQLENFLVRYETFVQSFIWWKNRVDELEKKMIEHENSNWYPEKDKELEEIVRESQQLLKKSSYDQESLTALAKELAILKSS